MQLINSLYTVFAILVFLGPALCSPNSGVTQAPERVQVGDAVDRVVEGFTSGSTAGKGTTTSVEVLASTKSFACPGDFDGNLRVNFADFVPFAGVFGAGSGDADYNALMDLDDSGSVDFADFVAFAGRFGTTCEAPPPQVVSIPDANLRAVIADSLGKPRDAPITRAEMQTLTELVARDAGIGDLTGLESATNMQVLDLVFNNVSDMLPLKNLRFLRYLNLHGNKLKALPPEVGNLTSLEQLYLFGNEIAGSIPPEVGKLINLRDLAIGLNKLTGSLPQEMRNMASLKNLGLSHNSISDISALSGMSGLRWLYLESNDISGRLPEGMGRLTNLESLYIDYNNITDISEVSGMTNLRELSLYFNRVMDISALLGLTNLQSVTLWGNPLSPSSVNSIAVLEETGVAVYGKALSKKEFDIDLVFLDDFAETSRYVIEQAALRWMSVIIRDVSDYVFEESMEFAIGGRTVEFHAGERIDDIRIYVTDLDSIQGDYRSVAGFGGPIRSRKNSHLPVLGYFTVRSSSTVGWELAVHEIAHALGFGTKWEENGLLRNGADPHFNGPLAISAFDSAGGEDYEGAKVPVSVDLGHWRYPVFRNEIMGPGGGIALSAITVQSFADLGYGVDVTQADSYTLPDATAGAKIAVSTPPYSGFGIDVSPWNLPIFRDAHSYRQSSIKAVPPAVLWDDARTGRLEHAERIWGRSTTSDVTNDSGKGGLAPSIHAEPNFICGAGIIRDPIYAVDPRGRAIRTVGER